MPPKKKELTKDELRQKIRDLEIRFMGYVSPINEPVRHKKQFEVIRLISRTYYDDYKEDRRISGTSKLEVLNKISELRQAAREMLADLSANEPEWRELEPMILARFDQPVIWDDERGRIFTKSIGKEVLRISANDLANVKVSMQPDRVVGLKPPPGMLLNEQYFPVRHKRLLMPFMVVEAKQGANAPGFRSIQHQTAFVVHHFLHAQRQLQERFSGTEPPLVWFFAYQGEEWRLYIGVLEEGKTQIHELWLGTIESKDGALQLLLIVEYIWSWARDVYRHTIWALLKQAIPDPREFSPASTDQRPTSSVFSTDSRLLLQQRDLDAMQIDSIDELLTDLTQDEIGTNDDFWPSQDQDSGCLYEASDHDFLLWAPGNQGSPAWTKTGSIRHADIIDFEFRCYEVDEIHSNNSGPGTQDDELGLLLDLATSSFGISNEDLEELAALWTLDFIPSPSSITEPDIRVTFCLQTYCDDHTWQIRRILNCIVWNATRTMGPADTLAHTDEPRHGQRSCPDLTDLKTAILRLRNLRGKESVLAALQDTSFILAPGSGDASPDWVTFEEIEIPISIAQGMKCLPTTSDLCGVKFHCINQCQGLWQIPADSDAQCYSILSPQAQHRLDGDSLLVIRSPLWPKSCPEFCLFITCQRAFDSFQRVNELLDEAFTRRDFYGDRQRWIQVNRNTLRSWRNAVALQAFRPPYKR